MHRTTDQFWQRYHALPEEVRERADKAFALLRSNPQHPSLQFKKVGVLWSARVDLAHRALAVGDGDDFVWVWIGSHDEYDRILKGG
ncbi:MAG: hypothetical protein HY713_05960 [candidate division NC10 bacterium]|nr:hypothetical protein [candidate division NC10 bacterium]